MKKILLAVALALSATSAWAVPPFVDSHDTNNSAAAAAAASATANQLQGQAQGQLQGQLQGQAQGQLQSTKNANNSKQSTSVNTYYEAEDIPVATAYSGTIAPTAPCMGGSSVGAQGVGLGVSFGTSWTSEECLILETARSFDQIGDAKSSLEVRCQAKYAKGTSACKAIAAGEAAKAASVMTPEAKATSAKLADSYTPVKGIPPAISSNGYYSVSTNPLSP